MNWFYEFISPWLSGFFAGAVVTYWIFKRTLKQERKIRIIQIKEGSGDGEDN